METSRTPTTQSATIAEALRTEGVTPLDARVLLRAVLGTGDAHLAAHPEQRLTPEQAQRYAEMVARRRGGEPIAYLTGEREFYSLELRVTPAVLVPRPETELLVDLVLERTPAGAAARVLDLATGSGCVAIAIAAHRPQARVTATDVSLAALALASENAARLGVAVEFVASDWLAALSGRRFETIVANPPYIAAGDPHLAEGDIRYEPLTALVAGPTGYECLEAVIAQARAHLAPGGWLVLEHGCEQAAGVRARLERSGYAAVFTACDLAGLERASGGRV